MNNYIINKALDAWLEKAANTLGLPVAWDNTKYTPPANGLYLEAHFLPADNDDVAIQGGAVIRRGVYQVTVVYPIDKGTQEPQKTAADICSEFQNNTAIPSTGISPVWVNGEPSAFSGIKDGTGYRIPVSIAYVVTA